MKKLFHIAAALTCFWATSNKNAHAADDFIFQGPIIIGGVQVNFLGTHNGSNISAICGVEEVAPGKLVRHPEYNLDMVKMEDNYIYKDYVIAHTYRSGDGTAPPPLKSGFHKVGNLLSFEFVDFNKRTVRKIIDTDNMTERSYEKRGNKWNLTQENKFKPQDVHNMYKYTTDLVCNSFITQYTGGAQVIPSMFGENPQMPAKDKANLYNASYKKQMLENGLSTP